MEDVDNERAGTDICPQEMVADRLTLETLENINLLPTSPDPTLPPSQILFSKYYPGMKTLNHGLIMIHLHLLTLHNVQNILGDLPCPQLGESGGLPGGVQMVGRRSDQSERR